MSSNLVIVAIPEETDRIWKVSSEKVPHLTLLFLGEVDAVQNLDKIMLFVEHAANTMLRRFYLPVDRRDELGADQADVLFFKKGRYDYKAIRDFRAALLQDSNIKTAYDSATQFDGVWQPHLTLGYPATPANPDVEDLRYFDVCFNKIAVWTGDFEGPEFLLKDYMDEFDALESVPMDVAMSNLEHFGVKGMRWGQRKEEVHPDIADVPKKTRKEASTDAEEFTRAKLYYGEGAGTRRKLIKAKVEAKKKDPLYAKAFDHFTKQTDLAKRADQARKERKRTDRKTATKKAVKKLNRGESLVHPVVLDVNRALVKSLRDASLGHAGDQEESMTQTVDLGSEFLSHHGVKGQKWGVRKQEVGSGGHIRINNRTNQAAVSTLTVMPILIGGPFGLPVFLAPRARAEFKAARIHNKNVAADAKWKRQIDKSKRGVEVHNKAADEINAKIGDFNNDKRWKNEDGSDINLTQNAAKQKEYDDSVTREVINPAYANAAVKVYGAKSPGGRYKFEVNDAATGTLKVRDTLNEDPVKHAAEDEAEIEVRFKLLRDANGRIIGFEFDDEDNVMAQTNDLGAEFLEHFGTKGMKWGVRKVKEGAKAVGRGLKKVGESLDEHFYETSIYSDVGHVNVHNKVADELDTKIARLQESPKYRGKSLKENAALKTEYKQDVAKVTNSAYRRAVKDVYGENTKGTKSAHYVDDARGARIEIRQKSTGTAIREADLPSMRKINKARREAAMQHADPVEVPDITIPLRLDQNGMVKGIGWVRSSTAKTPMIHTESLGEAFVLEHFGIKGMRWGVRKQREVSTTPITDTGILKRRTKVLAEGGESHPAHTDAVRAAVQKQKLKKSGTDALSTPELRELANRLQLEAQVETLATKKGKKLVTKQLEETGKQQLQRGIGKGIGKASPHVVRKARKGAATAAVAALI